MKVKISPTKQKIKKAAIELFNKNDTLSISTNHIASYAKISPGNLYYHYKNKQEIIIEIYLDMSQAFEKLNSFEEILSSDNPLLVLFNMFDKYAKLFWEYKFLLRDISTLITIYPSLKEIFVQKQDKRIEQIEGVFKYLISLDILTNIPNEQIPLRAKLNWFISAYWQVFISSNSKVTKQSIKETKELIFKIQIEPFLTQKGKKLYEKIDF